MNVMRSAAGTALVILAWLWIAPTAGAFEIVFQSDRDGNDSDLYLVSSDGGSERPLTDNDTPDATPSWSPDGSTIIYACAPDDNWEICTIDPSTLVVRQLTKTAADEFDPQYSSDGEQIVLETYPGRRGSDIAIMPASGGECCPPKRLTFTSTVTEQDPVAKPGSTTIGFAAGDRISTLDTRAPKKVARLTRGGQGDTDPTFSPAGELAFSRLRGAAHDIVVLTDGTTRRVTTGSEDDLQPSWTPDGNEIVFARATSIRRGVRIFRIGANGDGLKAVTAGGAYEDTEPAPQPTVASRPRARASRWPAAGAAPPPQARFARSGLRASAANLCDNTKNGNGGNNTFFGTSLRDCYYGAGGNDWLRGRGGRDTLRGQSGNDTLRAVDGSQDRAIDGGSGADQCYIDAADDPITISCTQH